MSPCNIVLYSPGLGSINRGLETFTGELYAALRQTPEINLTLFQGRGQVLSGARAVWTLKQDSKLYNLEPFRLLKPRSPRIEHIIFSVPLVLHCYSQPQTLIHFSETIPANILYHLRRRLGGSFKLLFSNGGPAAPEHYRRYDYVQVLTPAQKQEAIQAGYPEDRLFLVPYGLNCKPFSQPLSPDEITAKRRHWNLPVERSIILSVGAVNFSHKRMDWLIREFSQLDPTQFFLWIVGQTEAETQQVKALAASILPPTSYQFAVIPYSRMPDVYAVSDYFVLCSLSEGFGRAYIEAMAAGLPVMAHKTINTEWILGPDNLGLIDMTRANAIREKIAYFEREPTDKVVQAKRNQLATVSRFDWQQLKGQYVSMYEQILGDSGS